MALLLFGAAFRFRFGAQALRLRFAPPPLVLFLLSMLVSARFLFGFACRGYIAFLTLTFSLGRRRLASALLVFALCRGLTFETLALDFGGGLASAFLVLLALFLLRSLHSFGLLLALSLLRRKPRLMQGLDDVSTELLDPLGNFGRSPIAKPQFLPIDILAGAYDFEQLVVLPPLFILKGQHPDIELEKRDSGDRALPRD